MTDQPPMQREPEIEALGRVARRALRVLRWIAVAVGAAVIAAAVYIVIDPALIYREDVPTTSTVIAQQITLVCLGLPFVLPIGFTLGRNWRVALAIGAVFWFGPMALAGDDDWTFVLRMFASVVAVAALLVWRTLYGLSNPTAQRPDRAGEGAADDRERHPESELRE